MTGKTIIFTDIHGCSSEFRKLLKRVRLNPDEDTFVCLGDVIDSGPDAWGVLDILTELRAKMPVYRFIWVLGNHEKKFIDKHRKRKRFPEYSSHDLNYYLPLFRKLPLFVNTRDCIFVHAGYSENPKKNTKRLLLEDRSVLRKKRLYPGKLYIAGHSPISQPLYVDPYGNITEVETGMDLPEHGAIFLDTGCCNGNRLTAMVIENGVIRIHSVRSEQPKRTEDPD